MVRCCREGGEPGSIARHCPALSSAVHPAQLTFGICSRRHHPPHNCFDCRKARIISCRITVRSWNQRPSSPRSTKLANGACDESVEVIDRSPRVLQPAPADQPIAVSAPTATPGRSRFTISSPSINWSFTTGHWRDTNLMMLLCGGPGQAIEESHHGFRGGRGQPRLVGFLTKIRARRKLGAVERTRAIYCVALQQFALAQTSLDPD